MTTPCASTEPPVASPLSARPRIVSVDALRGLVMFLMIFVNDLAGVSTTIVPGWMRHFHGKSGMTFVDLVFPAFLFIVGMAIPVALGSRLNQGEAVWKTVRHIVVRALSLLFIGILMVHETPDSGRMGWSGALWCTLMYFSAILAFCTLSPPRQSNPSAHRMKSFQMVTTSIRALGLLFLVYLALAFRGEDGQRIVSLAPISVNPSWYGILGLIGWAYLVGSLVYLAFGNHRTALLGCMALLLCLYAADRKGAFQGFRLAQVVGIGDTLGSLPAITVAGILLATILVTPETSSVGSRLRFTLLFIGGCAVAALLLHGLYGINKNAATPSWCLWACAITAAFWLLFYFVSDVRPACWVSRSLAVAGQNVLLAYLLSDLLPSALGLFHLDGWYGGLAEPYLACAIARSAGCALVLLAITAGLNRLGFRLQL
jgi:heparan-alpha-glucosaminide N-acetyltransferase